MPSQFPSLVYPPATQLGTPPTHTPLGARLAERIAQMAVDDATYGWAAAHLAEALSRGLIQLQEIFDPADGSEPFSPLLDPDKCPAWALPWLGQLVGVQIPATATEAEAREIIHGLAGHKRGTPAMLAAAAGLYLTGEKTVYFRERDQDTPDPPYTLEVVTMDSETPDPAAVRAALIAQKPGGLVLNYRSSAFWDYEEMSSESDLAGIVYRDLPNVPFTSYWKLTLNDRTP